MSDPRAHQADILIVGASLGGLMTALALSRHGHRIVLLERSNDTDRTGAALQVDYGLLERLTGRRHASGLLPSGVQTWQATYRGLHAAAEGAGIALIANARVAEVGQDGEGAWAMTTDGRRFDAAILIGADGYQSVVRRHICPERPDAGFADYLAWVGFAEEDWVSARFPPHLHFLDAGPYVMLGFPLPAADGSLTPGKRRLGWAWYDAGHNHILRESGAVQGSLVKHSLRPGDMPEHVFADLAALARRHWPSPWREAMLACIERRAILGTPVVEYLPDRLALGRMALMGDAAHVATPMTGNGFATAATDALVLAEYLDEETLRDSPAAALTSYEATRLREVRANVQSGQRFSRDFVAGAMR